MRLRIIETEAYRGVEDKACHASKGRTARTEPMFMDAGTIYVYLIYGMYWMLNFVCEREGEPQAVLIRGLEGYSGPGKLTKAIRIDKSFNKKNICNNDLIWIEDDGYKAEIITSSRIGINYAGEPWASKPWNFKMKDLRL